MAEYIDHALSFDLAQHWWDLAKATGQAAVRRLVAATLAEFGPPL